VRILAIRHASIGRDLGFDWDCMIHNGFQWILRTAAQSEPDAVLLSMNASTPKFVSPQTHTCFVLMPATTFFNRQLTSNFSVRARKWLLFQHKQHEAKQNTAASWSCAFASSMTPLFALFFFIASVGVTSDAKQP